MITTSNHTTPHSPTYSELKSHMLHEAAQRIATSDPSHDLGHALRVLKHVEYLSSTEGGDLKILLPAALFHDIILYPKIDDRSHLSSIESGQLAYDILSKYPCYSEKEKLHVQIIISECSVSKNIQPKTLEGKILQDADLLESTGAIAIQRYACSVGLYEIPFYHLTDPLALNREKDHYALDILIERTGIIANRFKTETAKKMAQERIAFIEKFIEQFKKEII